MLRRVNTGVIQRYPAMKQTLSQRLFWGALAASVAPYAFFLLASRALRPNPLRLRFNESDVYDDLFDGELAASTP